MGSKHARSTKSVRTAGPSPYRRSEDGPARKTFSSRRVRTQEIAARHAKAIQQYELNLSGLDEETLRVLSAARDDPSPNTRSTQDSSEGIESGPFGPPVDDDEDNTWEDIEDGVEVADKEMEHLMAFANSYRQYGDKRTWRQRVQRQTDHWNTVMPRLVEAYLRWRYPPPGPPSPDDVSSQGTADPQTAQTSRSSTQDPLDSASSPHPSQTSAPSQPLAFEIDVYDIFSMSITASVASDTALSVAEALVANGYLGTTPVTPAVAISLPTLELLRRIRLVKASFSLEAFAKLVCYYYSIPYRRMVRNAISDAFDVYLEILRQVKKRVSGALGRDSPDWRACNSCPACCYKLEGEPSRSFSRMFCMDGNNSLKRMRPLGGRKVGDNRVFSDSDYFLSQDYVNGFANEVRAKGLKTGAGSSPSDSLPADNHDLDLSAPASLPLNQPCADAVPTNGDTHAADADTSSNDPDTASTRSIPPDSTSTIIPDDQYPVDEGDEVADPDADLNAEGDPTDGEALTSTCTKNWKAAQADEKKRSWDVFEETGVFASACRHGFILWIIDMVRSGELARYPLATTAKALDVLDKRTMCGYDVGCSFTATLRKSSLASRFEEAGCRMCVNAFHGYSHEYSCQIQHHPNSIKGMGLEDLETMERIFSASNQLAPVIRYASAYRRRVLIDVFFQQWDDEKYLNLGKMLYDNYRQALGIVREQGIVVAEAMKSLALTPEDLVKFASEERVYLGSLGKESAGDLHEIAYVEALQELRDVSTQLSRTNRRFLAVDGSPNLTFMAPNTGPTNYEDETSRTRKIETDRRYLDSRRKVLMLEVANLEVHLGIKHSWQPGDADYIRVAQYIATRKYQRALSNLQRLVVQRLFELHKMNISQTGYRMRRHIAKNMQTRSRALRTAIQVYNTAASALDPPRPKLDWDTVGHYQLLQEFELLNDTRADVREKPWAQPAVRETLRRARRLARAHEEIDAVNVEARRLHTAIRDEDALFVQVLRYLADSRDPVHGAVVEYTTRRRAANAHVLGTLRKMYDLDGYTGDPIPGRREGGAPLSPFGDSQGKKQGLEDVVMSDSVVQGRGVDNVDEEDLDDDDVQVELTALTDFCGSLAV